MTVWFVLNHFQTGDRTDDGPCLADYTDRALPIQLSVPTTDHESHSRHVSTQNLKAFAIIPRGRLQYTQLTGDYSTCEITRVIWLRPNIAAHSNTNIS